MELLVALAVLVAAAGAVIPVLPGALLAAGAIGIWAIANGVWWLLGAVVLLAGAALLLKYLIPARAARDAASNTALAIGLVLAVVGFFTIPVVGVVVGFVLGVFATEWATARDPGAAWRATWAAIKGIGLGIVVEAGAILLMAVLWVGALLARG